MGTVLYSDDWSSEEPTKMDRAEDLKTIVTTSDEYRRVGDDAWPMSDRELVEIVHGERSRKVTTKF